jgi:hypothetical protein
MSLRGVKRRSNSQSRGLLCSARNDSFGPRISEGLLILNRHIFLLSIPTRRATRQSRRTCASDCHCHQAVPQCACAESKISDLPSATPQPSGSFLKRGSRGKTLLQKSFPPVHPLSETIGTGSTGAISRVSFQPPPRAHNERTGQRTVPEHNIQSRATGRKRP